MTQPAPIVVSPNEPTIVVKFSASASVLFSIKCFNNVSESQFEIIGREFLEYAYLLRSNRLKQQIKLEEAK